MVFVWALIIWSGHAAEKRGTYGGTRDKWDWGAWYAIPQKIDKELRLKKSGGAVKQALQASQDVFKKRCFL